ncbi:alpha-D-ribose 1-methylphosphonate 5-triphosphate diphosphatase [Rhodobacterales bacterium HKCCE3408]|nr:alpha-D-ribose 1-methylphosphonate 5-triphosphate diphosphatase [Rhodobacterales bacterium HKCCE3408]
MTEETILANARLVLPDEVVTGSLRISDGRIAAIDTGTTVPPGAIDCGGDLLAPGLIELHTDNLERHISPRPHVDWPHDAAILAHDAELAGAGITTVFDAMRIGSITRARLRDRAYARALSTELAALRDSGALRISHILHLRAEICSETLEEEIAAFGPADRIGLVSLMDHTPGQRQFRDMGHLKRHFMRGNQMTEAEFESHIALLHDLSARNGARHEAAAVAFARAVGAVMASHDDTTPEQVARSAAHGIRLAEFPTTRAAAEACHANGIAVMMGAPNLVRGSSHSGNVAAAELAAAGLLDIMSSDYVPSALLLSALLLADLWDDLPRAIRTVTAAPAEATGLTDRGRLAPGLRADVIRIAANRPATAPRLRGVWSGGVRVS